MTFLEQALSKHEIAAVLEALATAHGFAMIVDKNGRLIFYSPANETITGIKAEDALGRHVTEVIENTRLHIVCKTGVAEIGAQQTIRGELYFVERIPIRAPSGDIIGALGMLMAADLNLFRQISSNLAEHENKRKSLGRHGINIFKSQYTFADILGKSWSLSAVKELASRTAKTEAPVLITGESGTGKELFAHAIHWASARCNGPLVRLNCGAIPQELLESELFGYDEGAFTGARKGGKKGKFEIAHGGTIFLDEIGDLPLRLQSKLLRVLDEKVVDPLGGTRPLAIDFRLITATNKVLPELVARGDFREDLYHRLSALVIRIPPLRERLEDIDDLVAYYLPILSKSLDVRVRGIDDGAIASLKTRSWRGNVRELLNVLGMAMISGEGDVIRASHILPEQPVVGVLREYSDVTGYQRARRVRREEITDAIDKTYGNKKRAAAILRIHRSTLYRKLRSS
jgi:transcriptional regulator with PAS, ATPase and Fis domain